MPFDGIVGVREEQDIFTSVFGAQVARVLGTATWEKEGLFELQIASIALLSRRWREAEGMISGEESLLVPQIRTSLDAAMTQYGGDARTYFNESHLGDIALKALFDGCLVSRGSRGTLVGGELFFQSGFEWALRRLR